METVGFICFLTAFFGTILFIVYNRYRKRKIVSYLRLFLAEGALNNVQFQDLFEKYTSFLSYTAGFPDENEYPRIYENEKFVNFRQRTKLVLTWATLLIFLGYAGALVADYFK